MKGQSLSLDIISTLPPNIIETILCLVPIQDAARTSILSRNWRYNWVTIPKLEFIEKDFEVTTDEDQQFNLDKTYDSPSERKNASARIFYAIYQILLVHRGPIHEFILSMHVNYRCFEIDQIILHLSRNHSVKKLKLDLICYNYEAPLSVFSLHQLTYLYLCWCELNYPPETFNGFSRLTSLHLEDVDTFTGTILRIICSSPLLKSVTLNTLHDKHDGPLYKRSTLTVADLIECLPLIEHLSISYLVIEACDAGPVPRELPASLVHLKSLSYNDMSFSDDYGLSFLVLLIRCSPNLEKLELLICEREEYESYEIEESVDYSDICLEHLKELKFILFNNLNPEMEFVKHVLAKSPVLKKVSIVLANEVVKDEELKMLRILLRCPRASRVVDIIVEHPHR